MSHAATNWAIMQRGLKPATKIVLWHLADCHNGHTGQCNPRQSVLADRCEMSRASVNRHLAELERRGLIRRHASVDPQTKRQRPTRYTLAFDDDFSAGAGPEITPGKQSEEAHRQTEISMSENGTRTQYLGEEAQDIAPSCLKVGHGKQVEPCLNSDENRVSKLDTKNPGIGTRNITDTPETDSSLRSESISSVSATLASPGGGVEFHDFDRFREWLVAHGVSDRRARGLIAKWRKEAGDERTIKAFLRVERAGIVDPVAWIIDHLNELARSTGWLKKFKEMNGL